MNIQLNLRIGIALFTILICLFVGFWTVGYFELNSYEKGIIKELEKSGLSCELKGKTTTGFPYMVSRNIEQLILKGKHDEHTTYVSVENVTIQKRVISPGKMYFDASSIKGSIDREHHINVKELGFVHTTPSPKAGIADVLTFAGCELNSHGSIVADLGKTTITQGIKNKTLYCKANSASSVFAGKTFSSVKGSAFLETPYRTWQAVQKEISDGVLTLLDEVECAVHAGKRSIPVLKGWIDFLEESQTALHVNVTLIDESKKQVETKFSLGFVEGMPSGKMTVQGSGDFYDTLAWKDTELDIRKEGIFAKDKNVYPFSETPWHEQPLLDENLVCDTLGMYSRGVFRQLIAEGEKDTERAETQYAVGEGYLLDGKYKRALTWFKRAAIQKHPKALLHLGYMYFSGLGCEQDRQLAQEFTEDALCFGGDFTRDIQEFADTSFQYWANEVTGSVVAEGKIR